MDGNKLDGYKRIPTAEQVDTRYYTTVNNRRRSRFLTAFLTLTFAFAVYSTFHAHNSYSNPYPLHPDPGFASRVLERCQALSRPAGPPEDFNQRTESDRFVQGTRPVLITNATVWSGEDDGKDVWKGDLLLDKGMILWVGKGGDSISIKRLQKMYGTTLDTYDAKGLWLTPGIVDLHSHIGVGPSPSLRGANDGNSRKGPVQPWLRSIDGLNTHDEGFRLAVAGGVTTSLVLPGSANAMGGQAFVIKLRPTKERTATAMLVEPPYGLNGTDPDYSKPPRWRHMKHACGENPARVYSQTRMDSIWELRETYNKAREIKEAQDEYCAKALNGHGLYQLGQFPEDLQYEAAVDILRGHVKVQTHCYEAVDLDDFVRLSNEFKFPVAAFHHAHESYLVPDLLKKAYGDKPPASAMFAAFARYKRESYRHSEFAPRILHDNGLRVVMKSDHSAIVSRYLLHEAQQAHYYGLPTNIALKSVITTSAEILGLDHRFGYIREGFDADVVLWDSHPLQIGATPAQVYIDGIPQLKDPYFTQKPESLQVPPKTPNFDHEVGETIKHEGLPPLTPQTTNSGIVMFTNVSSFWGLEDGQITEIYSFSDDLSAGKVVIKEGLPICFGKASSCVEYDTHPEVLTVDLHGGSISPGLTSYGSNLGLQEIAMESSTTDGVVRDALTGSVPGLLGPEPLIRAVDGLQFSTRDALLAYRAGVTSAITPPASSGFLSGLSVHFSTGARNKLENGAVLQDVTALHVAIHPGGDVSVSTQIAALRRLLLVSHTGTFADTYSRVQEGKIPLVIDAHSADIIASIVVLKKEVERVSGKKLKFTVTGATEAHLLARELAAASIGVILNPPRPFPYEWESTRILPGPPLSQDSTVVHLVSRGVIVGLGVMGVGGDPGISSWATRNTRFDISWAAIDAGGKISKAEALALGSTNVEKLLGVNTKSRESADLVVTSGGDLLDLKSKVIGIISPSRGLVDLL